MCVCVWLNIQCIRSGNVKHVINKIPGTVYVCTCMESVGFIRFVLISLKTNIECVIYDNMHAALNPYVYTSIYLKLLIDVYLCT